MKILAVDTSSSVCSVALLENDNVIDEINIEDGKTHSENLMPILDEVLKKNNLVVSNIDLIGVCAGPGSFTGIRIGVATVKPIIEVLKIKAASVTSLEVLAESEKGNEVICSLIDARNNQVYCGIFDKNINKLEEYMADDINVVIETLNKYPNIRFVGNGAILHKELIENTLKNVSFSEENKQFARNVGKIAYKKYLENDLYDANTINPIYLRKSQAERLKKN